VMDLVRDRKAAQRPHRQRHALDGLGPVHVRDADPLRHRSGWRPRRPGSSWEHSARRPSWCGSRCRAFQAAGASGR
jgi:hypothetical protein